MDWDAYLHLAFDEIRLAGARSTQVTRRIAAALTDLISVAPPERLPALQAQLDLLQEVVERTAASPDEARAALAPDGQGIGFDAGAR
jgi:uncharacterized membrane protein